MLGCLLISDDSATPGGPTGGVIVETEAYAGPEDQASHARAGLTRRTAPMFGAPGHAYVYLVYGMHSCMNVVGDQPGRAGAVLLRAVEPVFGVELMRARRGVSVAARASGSTQASSSVRSAASDARLGAGPARLCQALGVTRRLDGHDLTLGAQLWLAAPHVAEPLPHVVVGPRIGVAYAGEWAGRPWRFGVAGSPALSRPFPGEMPAARVSAARGGNAR